MERIICIAIGYIFVLSMDIYEKGFWEQVALMMLWPILVILFGIVMLVKLAHPKKAA